MVKRSSRNELERRTRMTGFAKFKGYLVEKGIPQTEVAELIGVSRPYLNMILNGQRGADFNLSQVITICNHYGIDIDEFFYAPKVSSRKPDEE